ncbi:MAG: hypothetical protein WC614_10330 [bacterium]
MNENLHRPLTLQELKKLSPPARNVNIEHKEKLSRLEKFAIWITNRVGTMRFFLIIFCWTLI